MIKSDETLDELLGGKLKILQKRKGYRFSIDSILLAHFVRIGQDMHLIELGAGSGVISLIVAWRLGCKVTGLELQGQLADMAERSIKLNSLEDRIELVSGDVRNVEKVSRPASSMPSCLTPLTAKGVRGE